MLKTKPIYISYAGPSLLETPLLNKGLAFSPKERLAFNLIGLLPMAYETIDEQAERCYQQYLEFKDPLNKHIYLRSVQDNNETLFYRLLSDHLVEMLPIIYTPTVGDACELFSDIYRSARGIFVSWEEREYMDDILSSVTKDKVKVIVVTDGERILGLGDQGVGGMGIAIGKLSLYTACGGISPAYTLPVALDVGTNNQRALSDPMYMGSRHPRIGRNEYDAFIDSFIDAVIRRWPGAMIQFEDFAQPNATPLLQRYRHRLCCFNDDIQGTAAITLGSLLAACSKKNELLIQQRLVIVGAGSAGCGIAELIVAAMVEQGLDDALARKQIFMIDKDGLLVQGAADLMDFQQRLAQQPTAIEHWKVASSSQNPDLQDVVSNSEATVLIGVSGVPGLFTEKVVKTLHWTCSKPIIFPLSNPCRKVEAHPQDIIRWTEGNAIVATGSPFGSVEYDGNLIEISQCNNSYIFPGIGLGVVACKASRITDEMLMVASTALASLAPKSDDPTQGILPPLTALKDISKRIAFEVGRVAQRQGFALETSEEELRGHIESNFWEPAYRSYRRVAMRAR
ncbi:MAG: NAD-dependent malic enzyme [Gammaproteobacteria bacterium]|nr:NAD-dependent malic enzyme [Gammaproteobacteria bacterium]